MASLSEKISQLTNPTPEYLDPEDDVNIETAAKIKSISKNKEDVLFTNSELRSKAAILLDDCDPAYVGKKVSRKSLGSIFYPGSKDEHSDSEDNDEIEKFKSCLTEHVESDENSEEFDELMESQEVDNDKEEVEDDDDEEAEEDGEEEDDDEEEEDDDDDVEDTETTQDIVNQFSQFDVSNELEKGDAVKEQLDIVNRLCEARIRLHKLLTTSHTFPQKDHWLAAKKDGGKEMDECMNKASAAAETVLNNCLNFQLEYFSRLNNDQETKTLSDEEILSDSDGEAEKSKEVKQSQKSVKLPKRKLKSQEYAEILSNHLKDLLPYRNSVLQTWDEKTKLSSGRITQKSFAAFETSVVKQIEQILQDKDRLLKRTQLKRTLYRILGKPDVSESQTENNEEPVSKQDMLLKDYDPEIFDDDDFYRQFLRDVIESKSVGIDPVSLRKQMEIQNVRSKIKKKVDTKASKGRKIRYDVDPKLVGYAIAEHSLADAARESILKSLCGGTLSVCVKN